MSDPVVPPRTAPPTTPAASMAAKGARGPAIISPGRATDAPEMLGSTPGHVAISPLTAELKYEALLLMDQRGV